MIFKVGTSLKRKRKKHWTDGKIQKRGRKNRFPPPQKVIFKKEKGVTASQKSCPGQ